MRLIEVTGARIQAGGKGWSRPKAPLRYKGAGTGGPDNNEAIGATVGGFEEGPESPYHMLRTMGASLRLLSVLRITQVIEELVFILILVVLHTHRIHT